MKKFTERYDTEQVAAIIEEATLGLFEAAQERGFVFDTEKDLSIQNLIKTVTAPEVYERAFSFYAHKKSPIWGGDVDVSVKFTQSSFAFKGIVATCSITWSSTGRNLAMSMAAVSSYQKAIELVAFIEALFRA